MQKMEKDCLPLFFSYLFNMYIMQLSYPEPVYVKFISLMNKFPKAPPAL